MRSFYLAILLSAAVGCGVTAPPEQEPVSTELLQQRAFDSSACADALAQQAEFANQALAFKASEVLDGILHQGIDCGIPTDFVTRVRAACPVIGAKPASDLSVDQVTAIREVR